MDLFLFQLHEWAAILVKVAHIIAGIAWIGASLYFVWLENSLQKVDEAKQEKGVAGELWALHGGGFYEVQKYALAPPEMPEKLHWFKWEAYATWASGMLLMLLVYYAQAQGHLASGESWVQDPAYGVLWSLSLLAIGVIVYECMTRYLHRFSRSFLACTLGWISLLCWACFESFSDRAAIIHVGAILGTFMVGNVFFSIIPAQRQFVDAIEAGAELPVMAIAEARMRSRLNNYLTLPVVICMLAGHIAHFFSDQLSWLALLLLMATAAYTRHFFNLRNQGAIRPHILVVSAVGYVGLLVAMHAGVFV